MPLPEPGCTVTRLPVLERILSPALQTSKPELLPAAGATKDQPSKLVPLTTVAAVLALAAVSQLVARSSRLTLVLGAVIVSAGASALASITTSSACDTVARLPVLVSIDVA